MYTIGEFAARGQVSARMLRHYDAIGLLTPALVDEWSGYRRYEDAQLPQLLRIVELRDLGCSLDDAATVLASEDEDRALREVLVRRRAEVAASIVDETARLARLDRRLSTLEGNHLMAEIEYRSVEPVTVYARSGVAAGSEGMPAVIDTLLPPLLAAMGAAGVAYREPGIFWYESIEGTDDLRVTVSWPAVGEAREGDGYEVVELPRLERAAVTVYRGEMAGIGRAWNDFMQAIVADGSQMVGGCREVYLETEPLPQTEWVTELIQEVA